MISSKAGASVTKGFEVKNWSESKQFANCEELEEGADGNWLPGSLKTLNTLSDPNGLEIEDLSSTEGEARNGEDKVKGAAAVVE